MWQRSFVGVSVLLGASVDEVLGAFPAGIETALGDLPQKLRDPRKVVRAQALATVAQEVAVALDQVTLR